MYASRPCLLLGLGHDCDLTAVQHGLACQANRRTPGFELGLFDRGALANDSFARCEHVHSACAALTRSRAVHGLIHHAIVQLSFRLQNDVTQDGSLL
eukprot:CAMPEP_0205919806 /NCGR_PEP_ID=MMETSP1325-20131115/10673_1 /ASSEMBLY_ACC=CAM_ASM_000708 /TAXON_ID=236786 /ORGANISM="Florenciella sp., Strain RCC1007" /LENGTH=96 /DNA_ID=CAMNT_0053287445 /DNA_START=229 /DNA_END=515 /DNA_ORIENTATION=-